MMSGLDGQRLPLARSNRNVEINRVGRDAIHGTFLSPETSAYHAHMRAVVIFYLGDIEGLHFLIAWRSHFQRRRKIRPQLETMHPARLVAFGHLLMNDAAACGHPLYVAGGDGAPVSHTVAVLHR